MSTTTATQGFVKPDPGDPTDPTLTNPNWDQLELRLGDNGLWLPQEYTSTTPSAPATGLKMFARSKARVLPGIIGPSGLDVTLQPNFFANKIAMWAAAGNSNLAASETIFGMAAPTIVGTRTARNVAATNFFSQTRRMGFVSAATAGSAAEWYQAVTQYFPSSTATVGGMFFVCRFGVSSAATNTTKRMFVGMRSSGSAMAAGTSVRTLTQVVGFSVEPGESNFRFISGGSAAPTGSGIVDLGANFPTNTINTDVYEARLFVPPGSLVWNYSLERLNTGQLIQGDTSALTASTQRPATGTLFAPHVFLSNGATAVAEGLDVISVYIETDN